MIETADKDRLHILDWKRAKRNSPAAWRVRSANHLSPLSGTVPERPGTAGHRVLSEVGVQRQKEGRGLKEPRDGKPRHPEVAVGAQLTATAQTHPPPSLPEWANAGVCEDPDEAPHLPPRRPVFTDDGPIEYTLRREERYSKVNRTM